MDIALWRDKLVYQGVSLGLVAMLCAAALVLGKHLTHEGIAKAEADDLAASLAQVLPAESSDNDLLNDTVKIGAGKTARGAGADDMTPITVYRARKAGRITGAVFRMAARGYAGDVVVLMGVDIEGRLLGARVVKHAETPGLGDKIDIAKSKWILAFDGKSLGDPPAEKWAVKKDGGVFDQFTGATITPRAVVKAVKSGLEFFALHREEILQ
ncbi:electron transport complex subunit RsxG [Caldichromatium japonicum]|uniref:Ion-translocating oxidoreductase complex subunit G n=1 Tax=Caldichromatium japonicum TaxID=2699430 RepID=A0A6G7VEZ0_9GAMM|nr:electron transport complex subunit RsxG [Caldichromatium japonicum]QIK38544.1 electron transport complex subunit RsxG [Caldichromatium japonicum]